MVFDTRRPDDDPDFEELEDDEFEDEDDEEEEDLDEDEEEEEEDEEFQEDLKNLGQGGADDNEVDDPR